MQSETRRHALLDSKLILAAAVTVASAAMPLQTASAAPPSASSFSRTTVVPLDQYHRESRIVRERSIGKEHVRFSADAQPIDPAALVLFEIQSESAEGVVVRWRCAARDNVAECFKKPIRVRYLPADERVVLSVKVVPAKPVPLHYARQ